MCLNELLILVASDHMICNLSVFSNLHTHRSISYATIIDGSTLKVIRFCPIDLTLSFTLSLVLILPNFSFNLLPVSEITHGLNCSVTFFLIILFFKIFQQNK